MIRDKLLPLMAIALFLGCQGPADEAAPGTAPAPKRMKVCTLDSDCILMESSCLGCCTRDAVNRNDSAGYLEYKQAACADVTGPVCGCCYFPAKASCISGSCLYQELEQKCIATPSPE